MAAPSYTNDHTDIALADSLTGYLQKNFAGGGGGTLGIGPDFSLHNNNCIDRQVTSNDRGIQYDNGTGINVTGSKVHIWQWLFVATAGLTDTLQNNGAYVFAGDGVSTNNRFHVEGSDTYGAAGRVGRCYPYRYVTSSSSSIPYRTLEGTPSGNPRYFGAGIKTTGTVKGANLGVDAVRYGTGAYLTAGELISAGDASDNAGSFAGYGAFGNAVAERDGICVKVGTSYELQGKFVIGQNNSQTPTACKFRSVDESIIIPDNVHCESDFSNIIIDHASSRAEFVNFNIQALGTFNLGGFQVNSANPVVTVDGGAWVGIGPTLMRSNTAFNGKTWRGCGVITTNGGTIDDSFIETSPATAAVIGSLADLTGNTFLSAGTGYAVDIGTIAASTTLTWDNTDSGYAATSGSTGNETIKVNYTDTGSPLTINVAAGASTPTVHNSGAGTVNVVSGLVTLTIDAGVTLVGAEVRIYDLDNSPAGSLGTELSGVESHTAATYQYTGTAANLIWVQIFKSGYVEFGQSLSIPSANATFDAILVPDTNS